MFALGLVPHRLTKEQMQASIHQCCDWKQMLQNDPKFLHIVIKGDETCFHHFEPLSSSATNVQKHTH